MRFKEPPLLLFRRSSEASLMGFWMFTICAREHGRRRGGAVMEGWFRRGLRDLMEREAGAERRVVTDRSYKRLALTHSIKAVLACSI